MLLVLMNLLWAGSYPAFKLLEPYLNAGELVTLRFGIAAIAVGLLWAWIPGPAPKGRDLVRVVAMGLIVFVLAPRLQVYGVHLGKAGDASILVALDPLITTIAAALFLHEKIPIRRWVGFVFGIFGVLLLSRVWSSEFRHLHGLWANLLFLSSFVCETTYSVVGKPLLNRTSMVKILGVALFGATFVNVLIDGHALVPQLPQLPGFVWALVVHLALVCTVFGYLLWYWVIRETEVNVTAMTIFLQPLMGLFLSVLFLGEQLHIGQLLGGSMIVTGLFVGIRERTIRRLQVPPPN